MSHESRRDDLLLYVAGALEDPERESLEAHLRGGCAVCEADRAAAEAVVAALALSPVPVEPPPSAMARLLERVARSPSARARGARSLSGLLVAAGLAAVVAAGVGAALALRFVAAPLRERASGAEERGRGLAKELAVLAAERDELRTLLAEQDEELAGLEETAERDDELIRFLREPGLHSVALTATDRQPNATARVFWQWDDYACHLHASGLRSPGSERVYALWLHTEDGDTVRVGTFRPDPDGEAALYARLPRDVGRVVRTSVTEEAIGADDEPRGALQLAAAVVDPRP